MARSRRTTSRRLHGWPGRLLAVLALVSQLALGAIVVSENRPADAGVWIDAVSVLCRAGQRSLDTPAPTHGRSSPRCAR